MSGISGISTSHKAISDRAMNSKRRVANRTLKELEEKMKKQRSPSKTRDRRKSAARTGSTVVQSPNDPATASVIDDVIMVNIAQRIRAPKHLNAPERIRGATVDEILLEEAFSPAAHREIYHTPETEGPKQKSIPTVSSDSFSFKTLIADAQMMATACRRSGLKDGEGIALYKLGVLQDNMLKYEEAIKAYKNYLKICEELDDSRGVALACNCIGVDYQKLAELVRLSDTAQYFKLLHRSLSFHKRHLSSTDLTGKFVACSNCGLVLAATEDYDEAIQYHKQALTVALQLKDKLMQSVAMGNIGYVGQRQGNYETAKEAISQHVDLAKSLGDAAAQSKGYQALGCFASAQREYEQAIDCFEVSHALAKSNACPGLAKVAKCYIGAARGNDRFESEMAKLAEKLRDQL